MNGQSSESDDEGTWTPVVLSGSSSTTSCCSGYPGPSSYNKNANFGGRNMVSNKSARRNEDEISISSEEPPQLKAVATTLGRMRPNDERLKSTAAAKAAAAAYPEIEEDEKSCQVEEIIQELAELLRRKNYLLAKLDEIVGGGGRKVERELHKTSTPVKKETTTTTTTPAMAIPKLRLEAGLSQVVAPGRNEAPQEHAWPRSYPSATSRAVPEASLDHDDSSRHRIESPVPTGNASAIRKGAMVMVVKNDAKQAFIYTGTIVEMDEDYVRLDRIRQIDQDGQLIKSLPYTLMFRPNSIVRVLDKNASVASPSQPASAAAAKKKSDSNESSRLGSSADHSSMLWKDQESPVQRPPRHQSTDYSSASEAPTAKYHFKQPAKKSRYPFVAGQRIQIKTRKLRLKGTVKSYKHGQLVLANVYDAREDKFVGEEMLFEDDQILSHKECELWRFEDHLPSPTTTEDLKPRAAPKDFASFMKTTRASALVTSSPEVKPKYVCRPAGYTPSCHQTREARPYADSISFR